MTDAIALLLTRNLLEVFGEPDASKRKSVIAETWAEVCVFVDPHGRYVGRDALNDAVSELYVRFPHFTFTPIGAPQTFHEVRRQAWGHGTKGESPQVTGLDVITVRDERIMALYALVDFGS